MRFNHRRRRNTRHKEVAELNITAFMNLMVVLVPFLLITAVFTRTAIIELSLPAADSATAETPPPRPQVLLYADHMEWSLADDAPTRRQHEKDQQDLRELRAWLMGLKQRQPDQESLLLLIAPDVAYERLIALMDHVRHYPASGDTEPKPLFPDIALGDAP